jgi:methionine-rich copper-binding protein CopC
MANLTARWSTGTRRTVAGALASVAALLTLGVPASPAWAHAQLLRTSPAGEATVTDPVTTVTLTFNEPVKQQSTTVVVSTSDGSSHSDGPARVTDTTVTQAVRPLPAGPVRVTWRTVSTDGDPIQGEFGFTVAPTAVPASAAPSSAPSSTSPAQPTDPATATHPQAAPKPTGSSVPWMPLSIGGGALVLVLGAVTLLWRRRSPTG